MTWITLRKPGARFDIKITSEIAKSIREKMVGHNGDNWCFVVSDIDILGEELKPNPVELRFDGLAGLVEEKIKLLNQVQELKEEIESLKNEITEMNERN